MAEQTTMADFARLSTCELANATDHDIEVSTMKQTILAERITRQRDYMHKLRNRMNTTQWKETFSIPGSRNEEYEHFLKRDGAESVPELRSWKTEGVHIRQPILHSLKHKASIYDIDLSTQGFDCGAILVTNPSLQDLCELGDRLESDIEGLDIDGRFFIDHFDESPKANRASQQENHITCSVDGFGVETTARPLEFLIERPSGPSDHDLSEAMIRVSCYQLQNFLCECAAMIVPVRC